MINNSDTIKQIAVDTVNIEASAIAKLADFIDDDFVRVVNLIYESKGRVIITGIGKSAIIAGKIVATLNSTGTPSIFMHAADAIHGDLGIIQPDDLVICLSKSGNTPEIKLLVPLIRNMGNRIVAMVSNTDSYLASHADYVLRATVTAEACPHNLAPTSSTTAQLVIGDALAVCLLTIRGFSAEHFARVHPGGALGKKLYTRVSDVIDHQLVPKVNINERIRPIIIEISSNRLGATAVLDDNGKLIGVITDGDLRRMLEREDDADHVTAKSIMTVNPKCIDYDALAIDAFNMMEKYKITQLIVLHNGKYMGMIHIHDILREGIV